ncbi:porin family protein [Pseudoalteromonas sp. Of7M-16]|uniref:porin family protein n=1 Tax=Pseudoalteromonas sp. Of7M-16 TaxID=2917756 RepID=UPI001EF52493|nr:porin family protein [Pseudoalteromonas sp. Of7M-16]MCG7551456.1 porin family protein [Pseudoalteromonas sp. Of7M-16]
MKTLSLLSLVLAAATSFSTMANISDDKHRVGAQLSGGSASYKSSSQDGDGVGQLYVYYNYQFDPTWALEVGLNGGGDSDKWECTDTQNRKFTCTQLNKTLFEIGANDLEYGNLIVAAKGQYKLTERNSLYGKLGANFYDYELNRGSKTLEEDDGVGFVAELGWQYDWQNGMAMNVNYQYLDMGDLDVSALGVGVSYRF